MVIAVVVLMDSLTPKPRYRHQNHISKMDMIYGHFKVLAAILDANFKISLSGDQIFLNIYYVFADSKHYRKPLIINHRLHNFGGRYIFSIN